MAEVRAPPIYIVYHICTVGDKWEEIVADQVNTIVTSGLYAATTAIYISVVGKDAMEWKPPHSIAGKTVIKHQSLDASCYERTAIRVMQTEFTADKPSNILYLHSKGVTKKGIEYAYTIDWRKYMEYYLVENYRNCLEVLATYDTCGVNWYHLPSHHYRGNFWWATSAHLSKLKDVVPGADYFAPELWLASVVPKAWSFHDSRVVHYTNPYPRTAYEGKMPMPNMSEAHVTMIDKELKEDAPWRVHRAFAAWLVDATQAQVVADLGSERAYSAFVWSLAMRGRTVVAISPFESSTDRIRNTLPSVQLRHADLATRCAMKLHVVKGALLEEEKKWIYPKATIIHFDGATNDMLYSAWLGRLESDGVVLLHNTGRIPGVKALYDSSPMYKINFYQGAGLGVLSTNRALIMQASTIHNVTMEIVTTTAEKGIIVHRADYGVHDRKMVPVKVQLEVYLITRREANMNALFGDPLPGAAKMLYAEVSIHGKRYVVQVAERDGAGGVSW